MVNKKIFSQRRQVFMEHMQPSSIAFIFASAENSDFYYLTGIIEPQAIAVFVAGKYILFSHSNELKNLIWQGPYIGQQRALADYGVDEAYPIAEADKLLPKLLVNKEIIYLNMNVEHITQVFTWLNEIAHQEKNGINMANSFVAAGSIIHPMRLIKDNFEVDTIKTASNITSQAILSVMRKCQPGMMEYELEAELMHEFIKYGARKSAFPPIIASGANSCILHYESNNQKLQAGSLVLVDVGAEYNHYAADITRTFPVNGKFTDEQRVVYEAVLATQLEVIAMIKPGVAWNHLQELSEQLVAKQLKALGIKGDVKNFYPHKIGHWLGLDVHDVGSYKVDEHNWRILQPGMILTVEPGIYIREEMPVAKKWFNIGVRIEDVILVTENGNEVLTKVPKTIDQLATLIGD